MILNEEEAKKILLKVIEYSKANSFETILIGYNTNNLRFALNSISTNGFSDGLTFVIKSNVGKKSGSVTINTINDDDIKEAVLKSESIAGLSPDNNEFLPPLEPQAFSKANNFDKSVENLDSEKRAFQVGTMIDNSIKNSTVTAGYWEDSISFNALLNSNELYAYNKASLASFSSTVRTKEGNGSSRVQNQYVNSNNFDVDSLSKKVIDRSLLSRKPKEIKPGKYTVILEPSAAADLITFMSYFMDARATDEGRSYFSKKDGGNKIGDKIVNENVNIYSDPCDSKCPWIPFTEEGIPRAKTIWYENGVLKNLIRSRYWAEKSGQPVVPQFANIIMEGTNKSVDELISTTDYGILVTRLWYIRTVDPQSILLTGLTRDGLFEIKDGKITNPIKNFRFNESPINMLNNIIEIGKAENGVGAETGDLQIFVPSLKVKNFNFSTLSDAI